MLRPGHDGWRKERAERLAFLVDGAAYFAALADAIEQAQATVWVVGRDLDHRIPLRPGGPPLARFLAAALRRRPGLTLRAGAAYGPFHDVQIAVDDRLVRVGSANLNNRSMRVDSECDLALEASAAGERRRIASLRNRLLAEHLGTDEEAVREALAARGSLVQAIESLREAERTPAPLALDSSEWAEELSASVFIADPERTIAPDALVGEFVSEDVPEAARNPWLRAAAVVALLLALGAAWRWTPLGEWVSLQRLTGWAAWMRASPVAPLLVVAAFVTGSFVMVPVTAMIVATALAFDPLRAVLYSLAGALAAAAATYGLGRALGRAAVRRLAGPRLNRLSRTLAKRGLLAMVAARMLPLGPFTLVNVVAGASHIRFHDFVLGSGLGLLPGTLAVNLFEDGLRAAVRQPSGAGFALLGALLVLFAVAVVWLRRRLRESEA